MADNIETKAASNQIDEVTKIEKNESWSNKLKIWLILVVILLIFWGVFYWLYSNATTVYVDNPLDSQITFKIWDQEEHTLWAYTWITVKIKSWINKLYVNWEEVWTFEKKSLDWKGFLNPTKDVYVQEYLIYWDLEKWEKELPTWKVTAFDNDLEWPFKQLEWIFITWDWNYWLNEEFPETLDLPEWKDYIIRSKVYRFDDFVELYNKEYYKWWDDENLDNSTQTWTENWKETNG